MFNSIILAFSASVDALGIGITYGMKNAKINFGAKCIIIIMCFVFSSCSFLLGDFLRSFMSMGFTNVLSSLILISIGILVLFDPVPFDFDNSKRYRCKRGFCAWFCNFFRCVLCWAWV